MISRDDMSQKQLLVIFADELKHVSLKNDNIVIKEKDAIRNQMSCSKLLYVCIIGDCTMTTKIIEKLLSYGASVSCLWSNLTQRFSIGTGLEGNYVLRQKQYDMAGWQLITARTIIQNKIANQWLLLQEIRNKSPELKDAIMKIKDIYDKVEQQNNPDSIRWLEGNASKLFFGNYFGEIGRYKRMPRTRNDIINFVLDIGYSMLFNFVDANVNLYGFDSYKGVYHTQFFERKSLVCDLMEPFRCIIDRQIKKSYNLGQIKEKDFRFHKNEYSLRLDKRQFYVKIMLDAILHYKKEIFDYVKLYYRAIMSEKYDIPTFYISQTKLWSSSPTTSPMTNSGHSLPNS